MICNTNNETERINEELKYEDLDRCFNSHISELLTIIVKEFLPRRYERHVQMKVFCSSGFKKHQLEMPSYLWNPPKTINGNCFTGNDSIYKACSKSPKCNLTR